MQCQENSSSYYQEQIRQPSFEEKFLALKEEIKKENDARQMRLPNIEPKVYAKMIAYIDTNFKNLGREMGSILNRMAIQVEKLANAIEEHSSRKLSSDIRECESITLSLEVCNTPTIFLNDFFSWNLIFRCFKVHHEFIIIFSNYFSIKWNFRKIYPVRSNSEQLTEIEFLKLPNE